MTHHVLFQRRHAVQGCVVILDKCKGATSKAASSQALDELMAQLHSRNDDDNDASRARGKRVRAEAPKLGHVGTLDPMASGALPILLGPATRLALHVPVDRKRYRALLRLGVETDTGDADGRQVKVDDAFAGLPEGFDLEPLLASLRGEITQTPSVYSAIKIAGRPAYERARAGEQVDMPSRRVQVYALEGAAVDARTVRLDVTCGTGTYVRSIGTDLAKACGTCGHLVELRRVASGVFDVPAEPGGALVVRVLSLREALETFCTAVEAGPAAVEVEKALSTGNARALFDAVEPFLALAPEAAPKAAAATTTSKHALLVHGEPRALVEVDAASKRCKALVQFPAYVV